MPTTTFVSGTVIDSIWLNEVDAIVWDIFGGASTVIGARSALGLGTAAVANLGTGAADAAYGNHLHTGVYEPVDATILRNSAIGVSVQAYDVDTAKLDVAQTFTISQRGTLTTDNDLSFDQSITNNFFCTPSGTGTLTFTNHTSGQSGFILLDNSGGYTISAAATTKVDGSFLDTVSTAGTYLLSYLSNGTNTYVVTSGALA